MPRWAPEDLQVPHRTQGAAGVLWGFSMDPWGRLGQGGSRSRTHEPAHPPRRNLSTKSHKCFHSFGCGGLARHGPRAPKSAQARPRAPAARWHAPWGCLSRARGAVADGECGGSRTRARVFWRFALWEPLRATPRWHARWFMKGLAAGQTSVATLAATRDPAGLEDSQTATTSRPRCAHKNVSNLLR